MFRRTITTILIAATCLTAHAAASAAPRLAPATATALTPELQTSVFTQSVGKPVSYAGKVPGTNAYIGLASQGGVVEAYICDSDKIAVWLKGKATGSSFTASNAANDVVFKATRKGTALVGSVTLGGKTILINTAKVSYPDGLWKAVDVVGKNFVKAGWVLLPDGTQRGAKTIVTVVGAVEPLSSSTGEPNIGGDTGTGSVPAVPAAPVPFNKKVTKKDPPPAVSCAHLEQEFNRLMAIYNSGPGEGFSDANRSTAGNGATGIYRQGMAMGCGFSPPPSGPGQAS